MEYLMPRTKKIHLAVTLTHKGAALTRSLCDNGVGSDNMVQDFAVVTVEVAGEYGENLCQACRMRIPYAPWMPARDGLTRKVWDAQNPADANGEG